MTNESLARTPRTRTTREQRGIALARERFEEIRRIGRWTWRVPSASDPETVYVVTLRPERCPCEDHHHTGLTCQHIIAATYVKAKTATCDGCKQGFRRRDLVELHEDNHDNLTYFDGDRLCRICADTAGVS